VVELAVVAGMPLTTAWVPQLVLPAEEVDAAKDGVLPGVREIDGLAQGTDETLPLVEP
jgi:hypothetical protein